MKAIVCELCGSNEFVKEDGYFVCQHCGTRYSLEEAKKLMIEGTVDVSGSVIKIDNTQDLKNLYELARRAKETSNIADAEKYYGLIVQSNPNDWESYFYSVFYTQVNNINVSHLPFHAQNIAKSIIPTFKLIDDNVHDDEERQKAFDELTIACLKGATTLKEVAKTYFNSIDTYNEIGLQCAKILLECACELEERGDIKNSLNLFKTINSQDYNKFAPPEMTKTITNLIKKYEPDYVQPGMIAFAGCYVATAVYGSYDCPEVWTLRRYRDFTLAETWYGRAFIRTYYAISPTLVKWFGKTDWFKKLWKPMLDRMVGDLQSKGVENTPYEDRKW
ncbi:RNA polymerase I-specific transcription initiation factor Rrn7 [Oribacterium sp. KHPX15]|uniref:TFIIB-type zinc finger domain-containing protein n=1 Tax=Oribacterium sp. KHPX15 TaxID=1855342 RepID=UPI0008985C06|nr:TFIIB-type zinc finger domain-containing protein [Oribacterium sp. KHPX15]SEA86502.1 RNA polymerase I-specific transcription initiation factor Rrn7 [Oribacterium sp. KHPX15]